MLNAVLLCFWFIRPQIIIARRAAPAGRAAAPRPPARPRAPSPPADLARPCEARVPAFFKFVYMFVYQPPEFHITVMYHAHSPRIHEHSKVRHTRYGETVSRAARACARR